ncbi:tetratricopeptide repeat protein [Micromonospora arborensis]|uniref:tetratricopeptide repeat protein n=1 Tax=Micromonospora arborensis TaxID=2116518 RepID=UPI0033D58A54
MHSLNSANNLATVHLAAGRGADALELLKQAHASCVRVPGRARLRRPSGWKP